MTRAAAILLQFTARALFISCLLTPILTQALGTQVLSNFNQPSQGVRERIGVSSWEAIPFTTDAQYTEFRSVEITAFTVLAPGNVFAEIWSTDAFAQPNAVVQVLAGPSAPSGLETYSANVSLSPNTSYFLVFGARNGAGSLGTLLFAQDNNLADTNPPAIYRMGTDFDGDGNINFVNRCRGSLNGSLNVTWSCGGPIAQRFFPKFRIVAEQAAPPTNFSLTSNPLSLDFGSVADGAVSAPSPASIRNDGNVAQDIGTLSASARFSITADACSGTTLGVAASCDVSLTFAPNHGGYTSGTLLIPAPNDPVMIYGLPLAGRVDAFPVGGSVNGLGASNTLELQNNGADRLTVIADGAFTFGVPVSDGDNYLVNIAQQPAGKLCSVSNGSGKISGGAVSNIAINCVDEQYTLGGVLTGLVPGDSVILSNNGGANLTLTQDGPFQFGTPLAFNSAYTVSVLTQPAAPSETCVVSNGTGVMPAKDVASVAVTCTVNTFSVGGSLSGLAAGTSVTLSNNGADPVTLTGDGAFTFPIALADGSNYAVSVSGQPPTQTCLIVNGSGALMGAPASNIQVSCTDTQYTVGGLLSGLEPGDSVVLQNNASGQLIMTTDGPFTFATPLTSGDPYAVSVLNQPAAPSETCRIINGAGLILASDITGIAVSCAVNSFSVGGTLSGLAPGQSITLQNNAGDNLVLFGDGSFTFPAQLADNSAYNASVLTQPVGQNCTVAGGSGTLAGSDVSSVSVTCVDLTYSIGGIVSGLVPGDTLVLQNNSGDDLTVGADGAFTFAISLTNAAPFAVTVLTQPAAPSEICEITNGTGTVQAANYDKAGVVCTTDAFSVGGQLTGLNSGETIGLQNNGGDSLSLTADGSFVFSTQIADGARYDISITQQPAGQTCSVTSGSATVAGATANGAMVSCSASPGGGGANPIPVMPTWLFMLCITLLGWLGAHSVNRGSP